VSDAVAVVMVVRDEPRDRLERALDALAAQTGVEPFPVYVAAPADDHPTLRALHPQGAVRVVIPVDNPAGARCAGLNSAVLAADAEVVVRVDARSRVAPNHVARSVARLRADLAVGVVGSIQWPAPVDGASAERGAVRALRNRWLLGNAGYRRPGASGPVDTVYLGAFRRPQLLDLGGYDERLHANEDFELCGRYRAAGQVVWLEEDLRVDYEPRAGTGELFAQYRAFGESKVAFWRATGERPNTRQLVALGLAGGGVLAFCTSLRRPRRALGLVLLGAVAVAVVDHVADPHERDLGVRAHACAASVATSTGWLSGVVRGVVRSLLRR
jgi:GT2 family glycosyltransferase